MSDRSSSSAEGEAILCATAAGNDVESAPFRIVSDEARSVEVHCCSAVRSIGRPIRQATMVRISGSSEAYPRCTHLLGESESGRIASAVVIADISVVKYEGNFGSMECARTAIEGRRRPGVYVRKCRSCAKCCLSSSLGERGDTPSRGFDRGPKAERRRCRVVRAVCIDNQVALLAICFAD